MKKLLLGSILLTTFAISITLFQISCSKPAHGELPLLLLSKKQLLVKYKWQVDEVLRNIDGTNAHYKRGEINTTGTNYDILQITFNSDGTGIYQDEAGVSHATTWQFASTDLRNLTLVIGAPNAATYDWKLVEITPEALHNTTAVGTGILLSARFTPIARDTPDK